MVRCQRRGAPQIVERLAGLGGELGLDESADGQRLRPVGVEGDGRGELALGVAEPVALEILARKRQVHSRGDVRRCATHFGRQSGFVGPDQRVPLLPNPLHLRQALRRRGPFVAVGAVEREAEAGQCAGEGLFRPRPLSGQLAWREEHHAGHARHDYRPPRHVVAQSTLCVTSREVCR